MMLGDADFEEVVQLITRQTGIVPKESHRMGIRRYLEERLEALGARGPVANLASFIAQDKEELASLVNRSTVNETYFFREERQYDLLRESVIPLLLKKTPTIRFWSAACSTGEEIYSLGLLARALRVPVELVASDINTDVLEKCREGVFKANSVRSVDGTKYRYLLDPYRHEDGTFVMPPELREAVRTVRVNLSDLAAPVPPPQVPLAQHVIFVRNVFIYFTREMRAKILQALASRCLADGGCLFVSMNEVASIDSGIIPPELKKIVKGNVFYFQKEA